MSKASLQFFTPKFSLKNEGEFLNTLSLYISARLSLSESLFLLEEQTEHKKQKMTFTLWREGIESGKSLSQVFEFEETLKVSEMTIYSAHIGDKSGTLGQSLKNASLHIENILTMRKKIVSAVAYPSVILVGTCGLVLGLLVFVFPKIIPLFTSLKVELPLSTRILISFSDLLRAYWWAIILAVLVFVPSVIFLYKKYKKSRQYGNYLFLRIPHVGSVVRLRILATVFDSLSVLLRGGQQLDAALVYVSNTVNFEEYRDALLAASTVVTEGKSLSVFFREKRKPFPLFIPGLISVGERTGNMENSIQDISHIIRNTLDDRLRIVTAALEPILMVTMSFVIGFIALSIILPIYGITSHFQNV